MTLVRSPIAKRALGACLAALIAVPALADTTWKIQVWGAKRASLIPYEWYAGEVSAKTGGRMKMEFTYDKGNPTEQLDLLKSGAADATYVCSQYVPTKAPLLTILDLPMFSPDNLIAMGRTELALADHPAIEAELAKWNAKMLLPTPLPQYQLMGTRKVTRVDDLKGAKIRMSGDMGRILAEYGAEVMTFPASESMAALKSGKIELVSLPYPSTFTAYKVQDSSKYATENISLGAALCYLAVNVKSWEALPPDVRKVMLDLREPLIKRYPESYAVEDAASFADFKAKGIELVKFNPVDRARLVARAIKTWDAWIDEREKQGLKGREVFEFTQKKIREYSK